MLKKLMAYSLITLAPATFAFESPDVAIDKFLAFELNGGRLSSDGFEEYAKTYAHLEDDHEEAGWDSVVVVDSAKVSNLSCKDNRCTATIQFTLHPTADLTGAPVIEYETGEDTDWEIEVENRKGDWRVLPVEDYPHISLSTYQQF